MVGHRQSDLLFGETGDSIRLMQGVHKRFNTTGSRRSFRDESEGPSIPSQFQTVVIDNSERQGFTSRAKRFDEYRYVTEAPGPGAYSSIDRSMICKSASASKKGSGTFASKSRRKNLFGVDPGRPGPGYYETSKREFISTSNDFNRAPYTATFATPIAQPTEKKVVAPPPNAYEIKRSITSNSGAGAAFKSTTKRSSSFLTPGMQVPAPNQYDANTNYILPRAPEPVASFKSGTKREFATSKAAASVPGPGSYEPYEKPDLSDIKRVQMPKRHYLCISAPAMPVPKPPPPPGPGAYELPTNFPADNQKRYMQSSFFLSTTGRTLQGSSTEGTNKPGPATYKPQIGEKQSFFYNSKGIWVG
ncbi:O(6)-methylguanine-induced apoptosis 2-like [Symsagittifera roscoffensis]|uniref:O(6)-methylguanine-induced apoptosis 2-like n=1 Tax=Symsagittifera roscoffensis TaxID=84072 RepID=UPI00307C3F3E